MINKYKWLFALWKREWIRSKKVLKKQVAIETLLVIGICIIYIFFYKSLNSFTAYTFKLPRAVYTFWGIEEKENYSNVFFYIMWFLLGANVWLIWLQCRQAIGSLWDEEEDGSIYTICNQMFSRDQIYIAKYTFNMIKYTCNYTYFYVIISVLAGSNNSGERISEIGHMASIYVKGIVVAFLFVSACFAYGSWARRRVIDYFQDILIIVTLGLGNLYKARDFFVLLIQRSNRNYAGVLEATRWMDWLRWLSPLSFINTFAEYRMSAVVVQMLVCIFVGSLLAYVGYNKYKVRKFI